MDVSTIHSLGDDIIFDGTNDCYVELECRAVVDDNRIMGSI